MALRRRGGPDWPRRLLRRVHGGARRTARRDALDRDYTGGRRYCWNSASMRESCPEENSVMHASSV